MTNLDEALERFHCCAMEYGSGFSNHGPMAAEALLALGHPALIPGLVDIYAPRLPPLPMADEGRVIPEGERTDALGRPERVADWLATFEAELAPGAWKATLTRWLPRLVPGVFAAACHGAIRTAHAVRSLHRDENALRLRELAFGLAYWASEYLELPGEPGAGPQPGFGPAALLDELELLAADRRCPGSITASARALEGDDRFASLLARVDLAKGAVPEFLAELCVAAAGLYLAHPEHRIIYAHAVTAPSALRLLLPHLDVAQQRVAAGHVLQAVAAIHASFGDPGRRFETSPPVSEEVLAIENSPDEIRYRAACSLEEHAIKLTEACLREYALCPDPILRRAAADAALQMGVSRGARGG